MPKFTSLHRVMLQYLDLWFDLLLLLKPAFRDLQWKIFWDPRKLSLINMNMIAMISSGNFTSWGSGIMDMFESQSHLFNLWKEDLLECLKDDVRGRDPLEECIGSGNFGWFQVKCPFGKFTKFSVEISIQDVEVWNVEVDILKCCGGSKPRLSTFLTNRRWNHQENPVHQNWVFPVRKNLTTVIQRVFDSDDDDDCDDYHSWWWLLDSWFNAFIISLQDKADHAAHQKDKDWPGKTQWFRVKDNGESPM